MKSVNIGIYNNTVKIKNKINTDKIDLKLKLERFLSSSEKNSLLAKLKMGTREWAKREINCIKGCRTYCLYCYAKGIAKHYKRCSEESWKIMEINPKATNKGYGRVRKKGLQPYDIMFPTSHNIIIEEPYFTACTNVLKKILESGNTVLVTIKPFLSVTKRLCELFQNYKEFMTYRFTIGSTNSNILKVLETNAPSFEERLESLKYAISKGFNASISIEPLLDSTPFDLIEKLEPHLPLLNYEKDIGTIWIGLLKTQYIPIDLRKGEVKKVLDNIILKLRFKNVYHYYEKLYDHPRIKWKESIVRMMILNDIKVKNLTS